MHSEVSVTVDRNQEFRFDLEGHEPMPSDVARRWLDDEFMRLECEPLRASGKVLLADKVLTVARAAGPVLLADPDWFQKFARATHGALAKAIVRIDLPSMAISY
ncbi:MAG: hypothetical protein KBF40_00800 [Giesbergeria sp.]|jgi:hypothetical protein|nr:hypothetical protein [Simplicispira sp.]MBP6118097.1 hypothetical protein [Giesbergeria sp.]MBP6159071.1 hypothetical protein [Giesbergeria sp.]MBP7084611.1 hypothetical protein [Giesbergeria sp.]MBP9782929.1 hypothetical protein [Giesbergeria sp.]